jgi:hypothetical protein
MRENIVATEGNILTNGDIYAKEIYLAVGVSKDSFYEITEEEYAEKVKAEERVGEK